MIMNKSTHAVYLAVTLLAAGSTYTMYQAMQAAQSAVASQAATSAAGLDKCAQVENVYRCKWVAVPVTAPRVAYLQPDLLPPPAK